MALRPPETDDEAESRRILNQVRRETDFSRGRSPRDGNGDGDDPIEQKGKAIANVLSILIVLAMIFWIAYVLA
jgi:hypothetical protein